MARLRAQCVRERRLMCGAPHLPIHSSFRSAVFDSACQLRVSIHLGLGAAECPRGRSAPSSLQSSLFHRAPHRSRAARTQYHMRSPPRARPRRAAGSARKPTETARGATTSRNRRPAARARPELPDGQHPRPARAPPGGGTVWRAPRARRTLLTVLNLFIARPRVRRSRPASRAQRPARTRTPPRVRPPDGSHRGPPPTRCGASCSPSPRGAWGRRAPEPGRGRRRRARTRPVALLRSPWSPPAARAGGSAGDVPGAGVIVVRGGGAPASRVKIDGRFL